MWYNIQWNITQTWNEWNNAICSNMDRPRDYYTKWSKSNKDKYYVISLINDTDELIYKTEIDPQT